MKNKYPHIFEPITVRRMTVKNRIVMTPMGTNYGEQNGEMSFLHINYYEQRAKGGTGLIIVENASVDSPQGSNGTTQLRIDLDNYIPRLFKLCESVHKHGACIAIQLNHAGASAMSSRIGMQPVSASDVPSKAGGEIPRPLEKDEIMHIVKKYGEAAKLSLLLNEECCTSNLCCCAGCLKTGSTTTDYNHVARLVYLCLHVILTTVYGRVYCTADWLVETDSVSGASDVT